MKHEKLRRLDEHRRKNIRVNGEYLLRRGCSMPAWVEITLDVLNDLDAADEEIEQLKKEQTKAACEHLRVYNELLARSELLEEENKRLRAALEAITKVEQGQRRIDIFTSVCDKCQERDTIAENALNQGKRLTAIDANANSKT